MDDGRDRDTFKLNFYFQVYNYFDELVKQPSSRWSCPLVGEKEFLFGAWKLIGMH